jgi:SAM-dependent methyltransferase
LGVYLRQYIKQHVNSYYDLGRYKKFFLGLDHRGLVGGLWDEIGTLQFEFLKNRGLTSSNYILDVGCGSFRVGVHLVDYLDPGHYYGIDISADLMNAGYKRELGPLDLQSKLPRDNLSCNNGFEAGQFGVTFDMAFALSLFTHLPLNHIKVCLSRLANVVRVGGVFYASVFLSPESHDWTQALHHARGGITTHPADDPYHYRMQDLAHCAVGLPWRFEPIGDWDHPRNQAMMMFTRTE